jgi:F-type H+-transporting ATPase subunit alpha
VGTALLGRVVDPLGRPLDGRPLEGALRPVPLEREAPPLYERASVHAPLHTGVLAIDAMFPIGRGQRELVIGDEGTGKTALALDILLRQKDTDVVAVYVAVGRRRAETWQLVETLRAQGGDWVVVFAAEEGSPGLRALAPFAGTAVAEFFRDRGGHALVVYDDLSAHAVAWRELSLLLRRPPGREAYPGDIFYLHARLLERAAQLSREQGGGSLTALPLAALEGGRLTAYIPTNLISITDGQIVLSRDLFAAGQKPAIDAGLSVSRVGAKAQPLALRELSAQLRLDYASFLELETFSRLGTRLEPTTERRLALGRRVRRLLRARRLAPMKLFDEVVILSLASDPERLLPIAEDDLELACSELLVEARARLPEVAARVERDAVLDESDRAKVNALLAGAFASAKGV